MDRYVTHASFTLERSYPVPPARVFAAWADPALKSRWFTGGDACPNHQLDFRVGGREAAAGGTQLVLTEQGAFLDGKEEPAWRENGTADQLKALATVLERTGLERTGLESTGLESSDG